MKRKSSTANYVLTLLFLAGCVVYFGINFLVHAVPGFK